MRECIFVFGPILPLQTNLLGLKYFKWISFNPIGYKNVKIFIIKIGNNHDGEEG